MSSDITPSDRPRHPLHLLLSGFLTGLSAPAWLFMGMAPPRVPSQDGVHAIWSSVGRDIATAARKYERERV